MTDRNRTAVIAALILGASAVHAPAQIPLGAEFRVDTRGSVYQIARNTRNMAMAPDGRFVVTWTTSNNAPFPNTDLEVVARRFDAVGVPQGPDFAVNTFTTRRQYDPIRGVSTTRGTSW